MSNLDSGHTQTNGSLDGINGDQTSLLAVSNVPNGISHKINGISSLHNLPSPATDSPATPDPITAAPDVKIDMDYQEQESDVRHEPLPIKAIDPIDKRDDESSIPHVDTHMDSSTVPIHVPYPNGSPMGDPLEDVKMGETNGHVNGHLDDVVMSEDTQTPAATPGISNEFASTNIDGGSSTSVVRSYPDEHDDDEPPAKRARMHSDADMASTAHSATPPPASAAMSNAASPAPPATTSSTLVPTTASSSTFPPGENTFSPAQYRFCQSTVRSLRKQKDAVPFLRPVDPVALNIPHYPAIIKTPMDFSTIERKLASSNPAKPDPNPNNPRYYSADEFVADFRLIVHNTLTFNGPDHVVTQMGKRLEEIFDKQIKQLPPAEKPIPKPARPIPPPPRKVETPPPPPPPPVAAPVAAPAPKKTQPVRRPSTSVPVIRRSDAEPVGRPKREIHPPPPKDLPYADAPKKHRKGKRVKDDGTGEQLKFCSKVLGELHKKIHYRFAHPFYEPVDWQKLEIPSYPKIVKKPMDMSTMRRKLENGEYVNATKFYDDFKLMIRNCFLFNPPGTPVNLAGMELQRLFDDKWKGLPPLHPPSEDDDEDEDDVDVSEEERLRYIAVMESQIENMRSDIANLKNQQPKKKEKKKEKKEKPPVASTSKPAPAKPPKAPSKKKAKKTVSDDDVLTFEQKKDLSDAIGKLEGARLERVIQIIHEGVPEIRDSTEEIELEIDQLPAAVLIKLYNFVLRPLRQPAPNKRSRSGKGTGTGGLKRKSMDEEKEAEKIRQLEERMALFEGATSAPVAARREADSDRSSDSSSDDSSGSDSE